MSNPKNTKEKSAWIRAIELVADRNGCDTALIIGHANIFGDEVREAEKEILEKEKGDTIASR